MMSLVSGEPATFETIEGAIAAIGDKTPMGDAFEGRGPQFTAYRGHRHRRCGLGLGATSVNGHQPDAR
jgi:hypothetical protein